MENEMGEFVIDSASGLIKWQGEILRKWFTISRAKVH